MQKLGTGNPEWFGLMQRRPELAAGLTIIETLIVLVIASVLATLVMIRWAPQNQDTAMTNILNALATRYAHVCERALLQGQTQLFVVDREGVQHIRPKRLSLPDIESNDALSDVVQWSEGWRVDLVVDGFPVSLPARTAPGIAVPQLRCDALGQRSPFRLTLGTGGHQAQLTMPIFGPWHITTTQRAN